MEREELEQLTASEQLAAALDLYRDDLVRMRQGHPHGGESVRELTYKGRRIRIVTRYEIEVDGVPVTGHLLMDLNGRIHYHAIPNQNFDSAVDRSTDHRPVSTLLGPVDEPPSHGGHGEGA